MKSLLLVASLFCCHLIIAQTTNPAPWCPHEYDDGATPKTHYISQVTIGNFSNISGTTQWPFPHYVYYNNLGPILFVPGSTKTITVHFDTLGNKCLNAFVDWNDNGVIEMTEWNFFTMNPGDSVSSIQLTVPFSGSMGSNRIRFALVEDTTQSCTNPCGNTFDWGETEDYDIYIGVTGVSSYENESISIYPNPSNGQLKITNDKNIEMISLYTSSSQLVHERSYVNEKELNLNLNVEPGLYILAIKTEEGWARKKVLIE